MDLIKLGFIPLTSLKRQYIEEAKDLEWRGFMSAADTKWAVVRKIEARIKSGEVWEPPF